MQNASRNLPPISFMIRLSGKPVLLRTLLVTTTLVVAIGLSVAQAEDVASKPDGKEVTFSPEGCTVEKFTVLSKSMNREIKAVVVLPPEYAQKPNARYPVLYALHGMLAPYASWSEMWPLRTSLSEHPMILVCFDGDKAGWYIDSTTKPDSQFATFFFNELIPYIDGHYRTRADGGSRGVTGFSMGGYGAFQYMLTHPEMFASISSLSGAFERLGERGKPPMESLVSLLGSFEKNKANFLKYGIYNRLEERIAKGEHLPAMFIHCGTEDDLITENRTLQTFLNEQNQKLAKDKKATLVFQYKESPGKHDWKFWRDASVGVADFHWRSFQQAAKAEGAK